MANQALSVRKLELPAILDRLASLCQFSLGSERARELGPSGEAWSGRVSARCHRRSARAARGSTGSDRWRRSGYPIPCRAGRQGLAIAALDLLLVADTLHAIHTFRRTLQRIQERRRAVPAPARVRGGACQPDRTRNDAQSDRFGPRRHPRHSERGVGPIPARGPGRHKGG